MLETKLRSVTAAVAVLAVVACAKTSPPNNGGSQSKTERHEALAVPEELAEEQALRVSMAPPPAAAPMRRQMVVGSMAQTLLQPPPTDREQYEHRDDNPFRLAAQDPLSTFSVDVDTAGYANVRRMFDEGVRPPIDAVRIEELVNYFPYDDPAPDGKHPLAISTEVAECPWNRDHLLARIGIKARAIDWGDRPASNLVFLLDVSGSMDQPNKLPLVKESVRLLLETLGENDRVAIVVYAGAAGLVLDSTPADRTLEILDALDRLQAGGSTAGGAGLELAYRVAQEGFVRGGLNRVILATDGDFNVGVSDQGSLVRMIEEKARGGVYLTVLGFGMGNLQDSTLEKLADRGNGNYGYIDSRLEARKVLVQEAGGTLLTVAKDVKIQVEMNPTRVAAYRLIGYENRMLAHQDFTDDSKDAGEIGAGHTVTALYEIVPLGVEIDLPGIEPLRYQTPTETRETALGGELMFVKLRYKAPDSDTSVPMSVAVEGRGRSLDEASADFHFASAVATFGLLLRESPLRGEASIDLARTLAERGRGDDESGYRGGFLDLLDSSGPILGHEQAHAIQ